MSEFGAPGSEPCPVCKQTGLHYCSDGTVTVKVALLGELRAEANALLENAVLTGNPAHLERGHAMLRVINAVMLPPLRNQETRP